MSTPSTLKLTICEFKDNFLGDSDGEGVNMDQSIANYCAAVEKSIKGDSAVIEIAWDIRSGEGDPNRYFSASDNEEDMREAVNHSREKVFSAGEFWVMTA